MGHDQHFDRDPLLSVGGRGISPDESNVASESQTLRFLDFADSQYFGSVRASRTLVSGEKGEITDGEITDGRARYLLDFRTPVEMPFRRRDAGQDDDLRGLHHRGI